ncbi:hypothetical protein RI820_000674 [Pluralibacter gergoviae]|uniref:hypothetical protein n=1 Tax=Pluralibacter gergoviae TaxID=61647 RepID=UPI0006AC4067|nr:hypothetical protein [Pluralibacter gergoviae]EKW6620653.1 hypothetical protein [Pluralibacter gergoviae]EKZ9513731.1 hypothetical protein [Pluralibacter gergoviae]ELC3015827.1 hypothetical protein [Pluralibacter gergoviae]ELC3020806.1 hypothetical protein [Pluralibacter gergoviae]KOQ91560.1 hypothetical protein ABW48_21320 [Pluralibacter gergoviae]
MKKTLCIIAFVVLTILFLLFMPDGAIYSDVRNNIAMSGDGEVAMDNYESVVLLIKLAISAALALAVVWIGSRRFGSAT